MLRLLADEHIDPDLVRGLRNRRSDLDIVRVHEVNLLGTPDPEILAWASREQRVFLTHDRNTVPGFSFDRVRSGEPMAGIIVLSDRLPLGVAVQEVLMVVVCSEPEELRDRVIYLPM